MTASQAISAFAATHLRIQLAAPLRAAAAARSAGLGPGAARRRAGRLTLVALVALLKMRGPATTDPIVATASTKAKRSTR